MIQSNPPSPIPDLDTDQIFKLLSRLGMRFDITVEHADVLDCDFPADESDVVSGGLIRMVKSAAQAGIDLKPVDLKEIDEARAFLNEDYPLVVAQTDGSTH